MSATYTWVNWNRHKRRYDVAAAVATLAFIGVFMGVTLGVERTGNMSPVIALVRALGACAVTLLHVVLAAGPLHRLSPLFAPLLYNRRHLGVLTFVVGAAHAGLSVVWYHGFGVIPAPLSVLTSNPHAAGLVLFPFEWFGVVALMVLLLMAATSHDFWLRNLSPRTWKTLHMSVYAAYAALVAHIGLGVLQLEKAPLPAILLGAGALSLTVLHLVAGLRERGAGPAATKEIEVADHSSIEEGGAKVIEGPTERIAVFKHQGRLCAVSNVCAHQGGPLGEGRIIDGCITCPWHGYQYAPETGASPPPFTERIDRYEVRVEGATAYVAASPAKEQPPASEKGGHHG